MAQNFNDVMGYKVVANNVVNELRKFKYNEIVVLDGGYAISVDTDDDGNKTVSLWMSTNDVNFMGHKTIKTIKMGKRCFGLVEKVIMLLETIDSYNNMVNNNMVDMVNEIDLFNVYVKDMLVNEYNDSVSTAKDFADAYGDMFAEQEYLCGGMDYVYDIRQMWVDWCWKNDVMSRDDAYKYYDSNRDMFICEDDMDEIVEGFDGTEDVGDGSCLLWAKNPYYVEQEQVENDSPYLDDVERVVKVIKDYVINYEGMLMDYNGFSASMCVPWDVFNEDDMKMLIEDEYMYKSVGYALMVDGLPLREILVYDDGVYVSVNAEWFDKVA